MSTTWITEFAVYDRHRKSISGLGRTFTSLEEAEEYKLWLESRRIENREEAEKERAAGFLEGNWKSHSYKQNWEHADWVVVERDITPWYRALVRT